MNKKEWALMVVLSPIMVPPGGLVIWLSVLTYLLRRKKTKNTMPLKNQNDMANTIKFTLLSDNAQKSRIT